MGAQGVAADHLRCWSNEGRTPGIRVFDVPRESVPPGTAIPPDETWSPGVTACRVQASGTVTCQGLNDEGQVGNGTRGYVAPPEAAPVH